MQVPVASYEQQEWSRRIVLAGIAAVVLMYAGWQNLHAPHDHFGGHAAALRSELQAASAAAAQHVGRTAEAATLAAAHLGHSPAAANSGSHVHDAATASPPPVWWSVVPFAALLLCIAILPLCRRTEHWWESNRNRFLVAAGLGALTLSYYALGYGHGVVDHATHAVSPAGWDAAVTVFTNAILVEYVPFITLLFSLYVISGGIVVEGRLAGTPRLNVALIGIGGLLASFIGTTGAAMLLIRPLLNANAHRRHVAHTVIFFIFVACNTGGCLLPIGDPPLFLGFLRGVPFLWTFELWPMWLFMNLLLLGVYFAWDTVRHRQENGDGSGTRESSDDSHANHGSLANSATTHIESRRIAIRGGINFMWLLGVIVCVAVLDPSRPVPGTQWHSPPYFRETMMLAFAGLSLWSTSAELRRRNAFSYAAIIEVAALFSGIFICMQAPVQILNASGASLGFDTPTKFFWGTGILSSFLDNAPTYVVFFETARAMGGDGPAVAGVWAPFLKAIALGSVFMGAMTYIGNGPNFMVKAIAEANNVRMPSFFGYMAYSVAVLLPASLLMNWLFL
ncbi:MAG: sodium:proton antiporter [Planctomycetaceae bacterium]